MRNQMIGLFALMFAILFSCTKDDRVNQVKNDGMVDFTIKTSIPQGIKTYASNNGGAVNLEGKGYILRYIMEAWTEDGVLAYRGCQTVSSSFTTQDVTFKVRLLAKKYNFLFWADFVTGYDAKDLYYATSINTGSTEAEVEASPVNVGDGLKAISMKSTAANYDICNDARDAYFKRVDVDLTTIDQVQGTILLERPFGKYRLVATDAPEGYLTSGEVKSARINYNVSAPTQSKFPTIFNVLTGEPDMTNGLLSMDSYYGAVTAVSKEDVVIYADQPNEKTYTNAIVLAYDYIFAPTETSGLTPQTVTFTATAYSGADGSTGEMKSRDIPNVPIVQNVLTTILGDFFTNTATMKIIVEDKFAGEIVYNQFINEDAATWFAAATGDKSATVSNNPSGGFDVVFNSTNANQLRFDLIPAAKMSAADAAVYFKDGFTLEVDAYVAPGSYVGFVMGMQGYSIYATVGGGTTNFDFTGGITYNPGGANGKADGDIKIVYRVTEGTTWVSGSPSRPLFTVDVYDSSNARVAGASGIYNGRVFRNGDGTINGNIVRPSSFFFENIALPSSITLKSVLVTAN